MPSTMTQCILQHEDGRFDTRWIETRLAKVSSFIRVIKTKELWKVTERGTTWPTERVLNFERDYIVMPSMTDAWRDKAGNRVLPIKKLTEN